MLNSLFKKHCCFLCNYMRSVLNNQSIYSSKLIIERRYFYLFFFNLFSDFTLLYLNIILVLYMEILFIIFLFSNKKIILGLQWMKKLMLNRIIFFFILIFFLNPYCIFIYVIFTILNIISFFNNNIRAIQFIKKLLVIRRNRSKFKNKIRFIDITFLISEYLRTRRTISFKEWNKYSNSIIDYINKME